MLARGKDLVFSDLQIQLPHGCYWRIAHRSVLALKHHIVIGGDVTVHDYRGNIGVIIYNNSDKPFYISRGPYRAAYLWKNFITCSRSVDFIYHWTRCGRVWLHWYKFNYIFYRCFQRIGCCWRLTICVQDRFSKFLNIIWPSVNCGWRPQVSWPIRPNYYVHPPFWGWRTSKNIPPQGVCRLRRKCRHRHQPVEVEI